MAPVHPRVLREIEIVKGLLRMRQEGAIFAVYAEENRLWYEPKAYDKTRIRWEDAEALVRNYFSPKKPVLVEQRQRRAAAR